MERPTSRDYPLTLPSCAVRPDWHAAQPQHPQANLATALFALAHQDRRLPSAQVPVGLLRRTQLNAACAIRTPALEIRRCA